MKVSIYSHIGQPHSIKDYLLKKTTTEMEGRVVEELCSYGDIQLFIGGLGGGGGRRRNRLK